MNDYLFTIKNLVKEYHQKNALDIDLLQLKSGKIYIIHGPNGAGKTTLLKILSMLEKPTSGEVIFKNFKYQDLYKDQNTLRHIRLQMTITLQSPYLFSGTVASNIAYGLSARKIPPDKIKNKVEAALKDFRLTKIASKNAKEISFGEAQRTSLARAFVLDTDMLMLDEPMANLDRESIDIVEDMILQRVDQKRCSFIITTHIMEQAHRLSGHVIHLNDGKSIILSSKSPNNDQIYALKCNC